MFFSQKKNCTSDCHVLLERKSNALWLESNTLKQICSGYCLWFRRIMLAFPKPYPRVQKYVKDLYAPIMFLNSNLFSIYYGLPFIAPNRMIFKIQFHRFMLLERSWWSPVSSPASKSVGLSATPTPMWTLPIVGVCLFQGSTFLLWLACCHSRCNCCIQATFAFLSIFSTYWGNSTLLL